MIKLTTAYWKINRLKKKHRVIQGGQGASKTFSILIIFFLIAVQSKSSVKITIVSDTYPSLKDGAISDMKEICESAGYNWDQIYNKTDKDLILYNSTIQFRNVDGHNFEQMKGVRRDYLFVNEATKVRYSTLDQMVTRSKVIFYDFNPDSEFWIHERIVNRDDCDFISLTYKDNECISKEEVNEIERRIELSKQPGATDQLKNWVRVYAYGEIGTFTDRQIYEYDFYKKLPATAKRIPSGLDFGQSPDPTIFINLWIDGVDVYIDEVFCENNLMYEKIEGAERLSVVDKLNGHEKGRLIIADSGNAKAIGDIRKHGYNVWGVKKRPGSVAQGIEIVRSYRLFISERSVNVKKGIEGWFFKVDKNGKIIPEPDGHEPDGLAALRYVLMEKNRLWN